MVMAVCAMHVAMGDFFVGGFAHVSDGQREAQRDAGQWMVAVQHDFVVGDIGHREDHRFFVRRIAFRHAFELHAHFQRLRQAIARLDLHQGWIVFTESIIRFDLDRVGIANFLAVELFFDLRQGVFIITVQVDHRLTAVFDQIVLRV